MIDPLLDDALLERDYIYASLEQRLTAGVSDIFLVGLLAFILNSLTQWIGFGQQYIPAIWLVVFPLYKLVCDATTGQTFGKWFMKIRLVQDKKDFPAVGWLAAWKRILIFLPLIFYFIVYIFFDYYVEERFSRATSLRTLSEASIFINNIHRFNNFLAWPWFICYVSTLLPLLFIKRAKTLYDLFAETVCVYQPPKL